MVFGSQGEAFIDVHANTDPYERELDRGIRRSSEDAEKILDIIGEQWGEDLADGVSKELGRHGKDYGKAVEKATETTTVEIKSKFKVDRHGRLHDAAGRFVSEFGDDVEREFNRLGAPGGPFSRIGQGLADAVGAGFNISGRSPLIALLTPLIGAIGAAIGALIQAVGALAALLTTLPALLTAIGFQVGVLFIAFQGLGERIQAAFAAKNAKELEKVLFGLDEATKRFIRSLLPLRDFWRDLQMVVQQNFFGALKTPIADLLKALRGPTLRGFAALATVMGTFFNSLAAFFASPAFVKFVTDVFPATIRWVQRSGDMLITVLDALVRMADIALPFLTKFGDMLVNNLTALALFLNEKAESGALKDWLDRMLLTMQSIFDLLGGILSFTATFLNELDKAGGKKLIDELALFLERLSVFLASPVGQKAMEGMIAALLLALQITEGLIFTLLLLFAAFETGKQAIAAFFSWFAGIIKKGITEAGEFIGGVAAKIYNFFRNLVDPIMSLKNTFFNAGRSLVQAFIDGIKSLAGALGGTGFWIANQIAKHLPGSPAEEGPLSGKGYTLYRGQRMMQDLIKGIQMEGQELRTATEQSLTNINFGKGAIQVNGEFSTREEAERTGSAVGKGINTILAVRQTRLAVRTL